MVRAQFLSVQSVLFLLHGMKWIEIRIWISYYSALLNLHKLPYLNAKLETSASSDWNIMIFICNLFIPGSEEFMIMNPAFLDGREFLRVGLTGNFNNGIFSRLRISQSGFWSNSNLVAQTRHHILLHCFAMRHEYVLHKMMVTCLYSLWSILSSYSSQQVLREQYNST